jgi:hypothetical protein
MRVEVFSVWSRRAVFDFFVMQLAHASCGRLLIFSDRRSVGRISFSDGPSVVFSIVFLAADRP